MASETSFQPGDWPNTDDAHLFWKHVPKDRTGTFRFTFVCTENSSAQQLADYLRTGDYLPVSVEPEAPYRWIVGGQTKPHIPSEAQLVSLHAWLQTTAAQFRATFHSMHWREERAA